MLFQCNTVVLLRIILVWVRRKDLVLALEKWLPVSKDIGIIFIQIPENKVQSIYSWASIIQCPNQFLFGKFKTNKSSIHKLTRELSFLKCQEKNGGYNIFKNMKIVYLTSYKQILQMYSLAAQTLTVTKKIYAITFNKV